MGIATLQEVYQQADKATTYAVVTHQPRDQAVAQS
jgi:hypothetical protein